MEKEVVLLHRRRARLPFFERFQNYDSEYATFAFFCKYLKNSCFRVKQCHTLLRQMIVSFQHSRNFQFLQVFPGVSSKIDATLR